MLLFFEAVRNRGTISSPKGGRTMSTNHKKSNQNIGKIVLVGVFGAISTVLMLLSFNVPFIPTFVIDFSDLPVLLGGYLLGPLHGSLVRSLKCC